MTAHQSVTLICAVICVVLAASIRVVTNILCAYDQHKSAVTVSVALMLAIVITCITGGIFLDDLRSRGANVRSDTLTEALEVYNRPRQGS